MDALLLIARLALAAVFIVAGIGKVLDLKGSQQAVRNFGVPAALAAPAGIALPFLELLIGALLIPVTTALYAAIAGFVLMLLFIAGISYNLIRGNKADCHCFGQFHSEPIGAMTLVRNGLFAALAGFIAIAGWNDVGASLLGWTDGRSGFDWLILAIGVVLLVGLVAEGWLVVHMLGQNGRLLLKLDELEERIEAFAAGNDAPAPVRTAEPVKREEPRGLAVGTTAPAFRLNGIYGETMTLDALRSQGKPVVLIFSDPGCGPCNALMPEVGEWQKSHAAKLNIAVISRGKLESNQEKAQKASLGLVLLQDNREVSEAYKANGTPSAVMVNSDGTIGSAVEGGAERIRQMIATLTGSSAPTAAKAPRTQPAPAAAPNGAKAAPAAARNDAQAQPTQPQIGEAAPAFSYPDLDGKLVSLANFRGSETVVIFWSPTCGFCKRMAEDIKSWELAPQANAPRAIIITSGDPGLNREFGFASPVLLDANTETMKAYGTGGTPTAILIDKDGKIASPMRVGQPGVMSLLKNEEVAAPPPPAQPSALKIGAQAPDVKLRDLAGDTFELASLIGRKAVVVFWNPTCGFCKRMVDDLKQWENSRPIDSPEIVLVSTGTVDANAEQGLRSIVLLDQGFQTGRAFGASGTPSAVLIDEKGRVASGVEVGAQKVLKLAGAPEAAKR